MADPKYENLPGIAYDQPDVYECGDLPEEDQVDDYPEDDNEHIEQLHLSVKDSFNKFKGKFVSDKVDFSERIGKRIRTGYRTGEWCLAAQGEPETPQEKYQRLRCEFSDLLDQVLEQKDANTENDKEELAKFAVQIEITKKTLEELKLDENNKADPRAKELHKILSQLESGSKSSEMKEHLNAHIKLKPEPATVAQTAKIAQLEHRLHQLESLSGIRDEDTLIKLQIATGERTLCGAASVLAARAATLRPSELSTCEQRVTALLANIDTIKNAANIDIERFAKIDELYKKVKEIEGISHTEILERMEALEALHNQASEFGKTLTELETTQEDVSCNLDNNKALLKGLQEVFSMNIDGIKQEIKKLEERIDKISA